MKWLASSCIVDTVRKINVLGEVYRCERHAHTRTVEHTHE